jgi:hypothetical protein
MIIPDEKWSFSSLKTFEQCPKKYYHLKVAQDIKDVAGSAAVYGTKFHEAAEEYMRDDTPLPKEFMFAKKLLDNLASICVGEGTIYCELEMGLKLTNVFGDPPRVEPIACAFNDPDYWWHGIADYVYVNDDYGISIDYKTSKNARYADLTQLDAVAVGLFALFPALQKIKSGLAFVVSGEFRHKTHYREDLESYINTFTPKLEKLSDTKESGVWNPISGPLCAWCPVEHCEHWRERR